MSDGDAEAGGLEKLLEAVSGALPREVPDLARVHPELALSRAGAAGFLAAGRRSRAEAAGGTAGSGGAIDVHVDGRHLASVGPAPGARVANTLVSPGMARREWIGRHGVFTETAVAVPALPLVCIQWQGGAGHLPELLLTLSEGAGEPGAHEGERVITWPTSGGSLVAAGVAGGRLRPGPGGPIVLPDPGAERVSLLLAGGSPTGIRAAIAAGAHLTGHTARAGRAPDDGLTLRAGVTELDEAVEWTRARVAARAFALASGGAKEHAPHTALLHGLAALAAADVEAARAVLDASAADDPVGALLAARFAAVTGDAGPAQVAADAILAGAPLEQPLWAPALPALADALRYAATDDVVRRLRETGSRALPMAGRPGRPLPMASPTGASRPSTVEAWPGVPLDGLLAGNPAPFVGDPDGAWADWRARLAAGFESGPAGPGTWDPGAGDGTAAARLVLELVHGLLGIVPDAPVGRVRIAPRLPAHVRAFEARGIRLGDARLRFGYESKGRTHRFRLEPESGAVPPLLVFEPLVPGRVARVRVDGAEATLESRPGASGTIVPVQLPVDAPREIEVELHDEGSPGRQPPSTSM